MHGLGCSAALREHYMCLLRNMLTAPLRKDGKDGIPQVLDIMNTYGFTRCAPKPTLRTNAQSNRNSSRLVNAVTSKYSRNLVYDG